MLILLMYFVCSLSKDLGDNLIANSRFSQPDIVSPRLSMKMSPRGIPGWTCSHYCQLDNCQVLIPIFLRSRIPFGDCKGQVLDLVSNQTEVVTQIFEATQGSHVLKIEYFIPMTYANKKYMHIYLNQKKILSYRPLISFDSSPYFLTLDAQTIKGRNNLTFASSGYSDTYGYRLTSVQLRRKINMQVQSFVSGAFNNSVVLAVVSFPGARVLLGELVSSFVSLDRMQLYFYHNRNYSYYTAMFLNNISALMNMKGSSALSVQKKIFGNFALHQQTFFSQFNYKQSYINREIISKSQDGFDFVTNNINLLVYSIPFYLSTIVFLYIIFRVTFNLEVSKIIRKYSFFGVTFLLMIFQGNIQQFSFYAFGELTNLFSVNLRHKLANFVIIDLFFVIVLSALGLNFFTWSQYRKKTKYFVDNVKINLGGSAAFTVSNGILFVLFGAFHQLLMKFPNLQLLIFGVTELVWMAVQMVMLDCKLYNRNWVVWRNILEGFLRVLFQLTSYVYSISASQKIGKYINEQIHLKQIILFIVLWAFQFIISILVIIYESVRMIYHFKVKNEKHIFGKIKIQQQIEANN